MDETKKNTNRAMLIFLAVLVVGAVVIPRWLRPKPVEVLPAAEAKSLQAAVEQSRRDGRPIFLEFSAEWCEYCRKMKAEVFPDPEVQSALKKVIVFEADYDKETALAERFGVTGIPVGFMLKVNGDNVSVVGQYDGAVDKDQFLKFLASAGK